MPASVERSIDSHPMKSRVFDALAKGESARSIAKWTDPPLHFTTIARYAKQVKHEAQKQFAVAKLLKAEQARELTAEESKELVHATKQALEANPVLSRIGRKFDRYDVLYPQAVEAKDFRGFASIDSAETKALELQARLLGLLDTAPTVQNNVLVLGLPPDHARAALPAPAGEVIDVEPVE